MVESTLMRNFIKLSILLLFLMESCAAQTFRILDKPIVFDAERKKLSMEYMAKRHGIVQDSAYIVPKMIVLHWTAIPTLEATYDAFRPSLLPGTRAGIAGASALNVSSQFLIDRDGTIFRLLPDTAFARHVIGLNYCAIGVENVGSEKVPLTKAQLKANEELVRYLKKKYDIQYLIGHYEYNLFRSTPLWKETDPTYQTVKINSCPCYLQKVKYNTARLL